MHARQGASHRRIIAATEGRTYSARDEKVCCCRWMDGLVRAVGMITINFLISAALGRIIHDSNGGY
jgi:hypothetical protein